MQVREKVEIREALYFSNVLWLRKVEKVGSLKWRVRSHLADWEIKNCTLLRRKADSEIKMHKAHHVRTTFGCWDMQQMHEAVLRSKFRRQNTRNTSSGALVEVECCKSARHCGWCEAHVEVIMAKTPQPWSTSGSREVDKLHTILVQSKSKHTKHTMFRPLFHGEICNKCMCCAGKYTSKSKC